MRYREEGAAGLVDRRVGQPSPRRATESELARARALYAEMYDGFTVKHFHEKLVERHGYRLGYTVTRLALQASGQVRKAPRRGAHRRKRPRRPLPGMLLHQDAARARLAGGPAAARPGGHARRRDERGLLGDPGRGGGHRLELPGAGRGDRRPGPVLCALHRPRQPLFPHARSAGGPVDREHPTQVGRALAELGIEHVAAYSPQARGRSERAFRTLEDRLPKELALAGITDIDAANAWLRAVYLPAHNARFAVAAEEAGSAFVPAAPHQWREVLCLQETRQVGNDNCVRWRGRRLQIPKSPLRPHFVRATRAAARIPRRRGRALLGAAPYRRLPAARRRMPMTWRRDPLRRRKGCGQRCRVAHTATTTEADNPCAT